MAVALAAVIGGHFTRLGYSGRIIAASATVALARVAGFTVQALAIHIGWLNLLQYLIPVGLTAAALGVVFHRIAPTTPVSRRQSRLGALADARA